MDKEIIGLQMFIRHESVLGDRLHVVPARWSERDGRPIGVSSNSELRHLDGGYDSDWPYYYGSDAEYRDVHAVTAGKAKVMADFLAKVEKALGKAQAREAGDRFVVFAGACKAQYGMARKRPGPQVAGLPCPVAMGALQRA